MKQLLGSTVRKNPTQDLSTPTTSSTVQVQSNTPEKAKDTKEKTNLQGWFFVS